MKRRILMAELVNGRMVARPGRWRLRIELSQSFSQKISRPSRVKKIATREATFFAASSGAEVGCVT